MMGMWTTPNYHILNDVKTYFNDVTSYFCDVPLPYYVPYFTRLQYGIYIRCVWTAHGHLYVIAPENVQVYNKMDSYHIRSFVEDSAR